MNTAAEPGVLQAVSAHARSRPDAPALVGSGEAVTYAKLVQLIRTGAEEMRSQGAGPGRFVALQMPRGTGMIVSILSALESGAAFVPLDPALPSERLNHILENLGDAIVYGRGEGHRPPSGGDGIATPADPAYVIYTSGSTGLPKGVVIERRSLEAFAHQMRILFDLTARDRVLQFASFSFDASIEEIFPALLAGSTIAVRGDDLWHPLELGRWAAEMKLSVLDLPTAYWHEICRVQAEEGACLIPPSVRLVVIGGEAALADRLAEWQEIVPGSVRLLNTYGPTEATVTSTCFDIPPAFRSNSLRVPIGRPLPGVTAYILDRRMEPVAAGVPGQLWLGGPGIARGYLNLPDLTAEKFVPELDGSQGRIFGTGDLVVKNENGDLEFLGRTDEQVKIRGFRIEPQEVEAAILSHEQVRRAVVVVRQQRPDVRRLVAYYEPDTPLSPSELRKHLESKLPEYVMPSALLEVPEFVLTAGGKIDRRALPHPELSETEPERDKLGAGIAELLATIWEEVLGVSRAAPADDFFLIGGDSLLATRVVSRIRRQLGVELPLKAVFENGTLEGLARAVEDALAGRPRRSRRVEPVARTTDLFPLSVEQERLWFFEKYIPGTDAYVIPATAELRGPIDADLFHRALALLSRRHESLRTVFVEKDGAPLQRVLSSLEPGFTFLDLKDRSASDGAPEQTKPAGPRFDLAEGPLVHVALARLGPESHVLRLWIHHLVADGWSLQVIAEDLSAIYRSLAEGREPELEELEIGYPDFAIHQRDWLGGAEAKGQLGYWRKLLQGFPVLDLPVDRVRPKVRSFDSKHHRFSIGRAQLEGVHRLARDFSSTSFMVLLSLFGVMISRYSGQDDIVIGAPVAGRHLDELEPLIGFFVNILPHRLDLSGDPTLKDLLGRVREATLLALGNQDYPFEQLVAEIDPDRDPSRSALAQVMFVLHNTPAARLELAPGQVARFESLTNAAPVDLTLDLTETAGGFDGFIHYDAGLFEPSTVERMSRHFVRLLDQGIANPETAISAFDLMDAGERQKIIFDWNDTETAYPHGLLVHELFEEQAKQRPNEIAVDFEDLRLTYHQVDRMAGSLAAHLSGLGIREGELVGVCLERSAAMIIALLAILKSGGAYLPLDPEYPAERLAMMLGDSGASVLITQTAFTHSLPRVERLVVMDRDWAAIENLSPLRSEPGKSPDSPAYLMYTSGSTGLPKGILIPHRGIVRLVCDTDYLQLGPQDVVAQAANASFDAATFEVWGPLLNGGKVVGVPKEALLSPESLRRLLHEKQINTLFVTTALFNQVANDKPDAFNSLDHLLFGGEAADPKRVKTIFDSGGPGRLLHMYGPTESTTFATWHEVKEVPARARTVPIGRPIANTKVHILDQQMRPAAPGIPGEIYIGGAGLSTGYLNRPELTTERFVSDPFDPGGKLFRTGDRARYTPGGDIEFLGRLDLQVKVRGFRIEPGEIETVLLHHTGVSEAAVVVLEDPAGDKSLAAYVVSPETTGSVLRAFLKQTLPAYMVPSSILRLEAMPLTPNGKVDRSALPSPVARSDFESSEYVTPRDSTEERLAVIWADVLGVSRVGAHDDFFDLGGHSLKATKVIWRIRDKFGVDLPLRDVFEHSTLESLAGRVRAAEPADLVAPIKPLPRGGRT